MSQSRDELTFSIGFSEPEISAAKKIEETPIAMDRRCVLERPWIMIGDVYLG
jgi:hypothetical protein